MQVTLAPSAAVPEGASITVTCEDPAASPPTLYTWYHNSHWLQEGPSASLSIPVATRLMPVPTHAKSRMPRAHAVPGLQPCKSSVSRGPRIGVPRVAEGTFGPRWGWAQDCSGLGMGTWGKKDIDGEDRGPVTPA